MLSEAQVRQAVLARAGDQCECTLSSCNHPTVKGGTRCTRKLGRDWQLHRINRSLAHTVSNCQALCRPCHEGTRSYGRS